MKKTILITISAIILNFAILSSPALAISTGGDKGGNCAYDYQCPTNMICVNKKCTNTIDALTSRPASTDTNIKEHYKETIAVANLPNIELESAMSEIILLILRVTMLLTIIAIVVAAIYYIISRGKEEDITKAKDIILYLVIGIAIMAAAYGIVAGIAQFDFFK